MVLKNACSYETISGSGMACAPHQLAICRSDGVHCSLECRDSVVVSAQLSAEHAAR